MSSKGANSLEEAVQEILDEIHYKEGRPREGNCLTFLECYFPRITFEHQSKTNVIEMGVFKLPGLAEAELSITIPSGSDEEETQNLLERVNSNYFAGSPGVNKDLIIDIRSEERR